MFLDLARPFATIDAAVVQLDATFLSTAVSLNEAREVPAGRLNANAMPGIEV